MSQIIARSFLEWSTEEVVKWMAGLSLSQDYSRQFRGSNINGVMLVKLNPVALDELGITDVGDRVKFLQHITTMRADLMTTNSSQTRRVRSPLKARRFSETIRPLNRTSTHAVNDPTLERGVSPTKPISYDRGLSYEPTASPRVSSPTKHPWPGSKSGSPVKFHVTDSPTTSGMTSPVKYMSATSSPTRMHYVLETDGHEEGFQMFRNQHARYLSKSMDGLLQEGDAPNLVLERKESYSTQLVAILREENATLQRELESYYQRVRKLQKVEQEVERIREAHRLLETTTTRKEKVEAAMRQRLQNEVCRLRETCLKQNVERMRQQGPNSPTKKEGVKTRREIARRDTMIMKLIKQNKEHSAAREKLEEDLYSTKAALKVKAEWNEDSDGASLSDSQKWRPNSELENKAASVYTESIEKLRSVLSAMQTMSQKRERLEKGVRRQLEADIQRLKGEKGEEEELQPRTELEGRIATLEADVAKWEHKCLELVAEKQMSLESAVVPRDTRISQLERMVSEREDMVEELRQQRGEYVGKLADANRKIVELETRVSSLQARLEEKETVLQVMQHSFLDPEDGSPDDSLYSFHGSPKKSTFSDMQLSQRSGSPLSDAMGDILTCSPPMKHREFHASNVPMMNGLTEQMNGTYREYALPPYGANVRHVGPVPNIPRTRKPRLSQPNIALTSETNHKRRGVKSRTPPPDYRVAASPKGKKRHGSVGALLDNDNDSPAQNGHLELFESLIGGGGLPKAFVSSSYRHQHSNSSPSYPHKVHL